MIRRPSRLATMVCIVGLLALEVYLVWAVFFEPNSGYVEVQAKASDCTTRSTGRSSTETDCTASFTYQGKAYTTSIMELHSGDIETLSVKKSALGKAGDISSSDTLEHHLDTGRLIWIVAIGVALLLLLALRIGIYVRAHRQGMTVREFEANASASRARWLANRAATKQRG